MDMVRKGIPDHRDTPSLTSVSTQHLEWDGERLLSRRPGLARPQPALSAITTFPEACTSHPGL